MPEEEEHGKKIVSMGVVLNTRACMFHIGRSGSTVLAGMLGQHENVLSDGEIYGGDPKRWTPKNPQPPLDYLRNRLKVAADRVYLFEMKYWHAAVIRVPFKSFVQFLFDNGFDRFIILKRRNFLKKIVSSRRAHESGMWHLPPGKQPSFMAVRIDLLNLRMDQTVGTLVSFLDGYQRYFDLLDAILDGRPVLRLSYEDDIENDPFIAYGKTCRFLGLEQIHVKIPLVRTTPFPLTNSIANYAEVEAALRGTPFHWMVSE